MINQDPSLLAPGTLAEQGASYFPTTGQSVATAQLLESKRQLAMELAMQNKQAAEIADMVHKFLTGGEGIPRDSSEFKVTQLLASQALTLPVISSLSGGNFMNMALGLEQAIGWSGGGIAGSEVGLAQNNPLVQQLTLDFYKVASDHFMDATGNLNLRRTSGLNREELGDVFTMLGEGGALRGEQLMNFDSSGQLVTDESVAQRFSERAEKLARSLSAMKDIFGGEPMRNLQARLEEFTGLSVGNALDERMMERRLMEMKTSAAAYNFGNLEAVISQQAEDVHRLQTLGIGPRTAGSMVHEVMGQNFGAYTAGMANTQAFAEAGYYTGAPTLREARYRSMSSMAALQEESPVTIVARYIQGIHMETDPEFSAAVETRIQAINKATTQDELDAAEYNLSEFLTDSGKLGGHTIDSFEDAMGGIPAITENMDSETLRRKDRDLRTREQTRSLARVREILITDNEYLEGRSDTEKSVLDTMMTKLDSTTHAEFIEALSESDFTTSKGREVANKRMTSIIARSGMAGLDREGQEPIEFLNNVMSLAVDERGAEQLIQDLVVLNDQLQGSGHYENYMREGDIDIQAKNELWGLTRQDFLQDSGHIPDVFSAGFREAMGATPTVTRADVMSTLVDVTRDDVDVSKLSDRSKEIRKKYKDDIFRIYRNVYDAEGNVEENFSKDLDRWREELGDDTMAQMLQLDPESETLEADMVAALANDETRGLFYEGLEDRGFLVMGRAGKDQYMIQQSTLEKAAEEADLHVLEEQRKEETNLLDILDDVMGVDVKEALEQGRSMESITNSYLQKVLDKDEGALEALDYMSEGETAGFLEAIDNQMAAERKIKNKEGQEDDVVEKADARLSQLQSLKTDIITNNGDNYLGRIILVDDQNLTVDLYRNSNSTE